MPGPHPVVPDGWTRRPDGTVVVHRHAYPVEISARFAASEIEWAELTGDPPFTPYPCRVCGSRASYHTDTKRTGEGLYQTALQCGDCGGLHLIPFAGAA